MGFDLIIILLAIEIIHSLIILLGFFNNKQVTDLLKECAKMKEFDHHNVLNLKGVCLDGGPVPCIIMPFMTNGSLQSYLKENRESFVMDSRSTHSKDKVHTR